MKQTVRYDKYWFPHYFGVWLTVASLIGGCATTPRVTIMDVATKLQFLRDGVTTREEIILKLGEPSGQFEGERILTYILSIDNASKLRILPRQFALNPDDPRLYKLNPSVCSLVLVFRSDNVLEKHSLVGTKDEIN